ILTNNKDQNSNFKKGESEYLVVEACEYKRSFLNLSPKILVITNIEPDHLDYYKDLEDIKSAFAELKSKVPADGFVITEAEYKEVKPDFELLVPGEHNISNAQAAIAAVEKIGITNQKAKEFLKDFRGTWRRLEYKGEKAGRIFYDDYAHHPTEIKASLSALREKYPDRELVCVFQPHQQERTKIFFDEFVKALSLADTVFVTPIFMAREKPDTTISNKILAEAVNKFVPAETVENVEELILLTPFTLKGDPNKNFCIVMMGAGDIYKWTPKLIE
ncbi:MAG: cyanophycin synthetase, partial [Patescibacteria group bacterium]